MPFRDALTGGIDLSEEGRQQVLQAARQGRARPAVPRPDGAIGESDSGPEPTDWLLMGLAGAVVSEIWRRTVAKKFRARVVPAMSGRVEAGLRDFAAALDRHPDLWCCQREYVAFLAGGHCAVPMAEAARRLMRNDGAALMTLLGAGSTQGDLGLPET